MINYNNDAITPPPPDDTEVDNIRPGLILELAAHLGKPRIGYRELTTNGLDQYEGSIGKDKEKIVLIGIDPLRHRVYFEDFATGIENKLDFKAVGTEDAEGKTGKRVGNELSSYTHVHPTIAGKKHAGKLTSLNMAKDPKNAKIVFRSNNGTNGFILERRGTRGWAPDQIVDTTKALDHIGCKVIIDNVRDELLKIKTVIGMLSDWFGIRIARGTKIYVIDVTTDERTKVPVPENLDSHEYELDKMKSGIAITGNLKHVTKSKDAGNVDVYIKHIKIRTIHCGFLVTGWINCNELEELITRDDYGENKEFDDRLEEYLKREGFEREQETAQPKMKNQKQVEEMIGDILGLYRDKYPEEFVSIFGDLAVSGIPGTTNKRHAGDEEWKHYKDNQKIVKGAGDPEGDEITTKGKGRKRRKGPKITTPPTPPNAKGPGPGVEDGGTRTAYVRSRQTTEQIDGNVKPRLPVFHIPRGSNPTLFIEKDPKRGIILIDNTDRPASEIVLKAAGPKRNDILLPLLVRAVVKYQLMNTDISVEEYDRRCDEMLNDMWGLASRK